MIKKNKTHDKDRQEKTTGKHTQEQSRRTQHTQTSRTDRKYHNKQNGCSESCIQQ